MPIEIKSIDIIDYVENALKDARIALSSDNFRVKFNLAYGAIIKLAVSVVAMAGYRLNGMGHHVKFMSLMASLLSEGGMLGAFLRDMRYVRTDDLYSGVDLEKNGRYARIEDKLEDCLNFVFRKMMQTLPLRHQL